jgi:methylmalonyl-CoA/ethylmalonyl-CoA epimerase
MTKDMPKEGMVFKKINHIGIGVRDIDQATKLWTEVFGVKARPPVTEVDMKVVMLPLGDVMIELLAPVGDQSVMGKFLEKRGEGLHHICFEVDDINSAMEELTAKGLTLIDKEPREGGEGKIAFLHPKSTHGVLTEIVQVQ